MGKAMNQTHKDTSDISNNNSTATEQSHEQVGEVIGFSLWISHYKLWEEVVFLCYNQAKLNNQLLLVDNQSSICVFYNSDYVSDIRYVAWEMQLKCNSEKLLNSTTANYKAFEEVV